MSEDFDPLTTESSVTAISYSGIVLMMSVVIALGSVAGFIFGGNAFGFSVLFGGVLSFINVYWLDRSTRALFNQTAVASTGFLAAKYILRYFAIGLILLAVYLTGAIPVAGVILGLSSFAIAVVIQGMKSIFSSSI